MTGLSWSLLFCLLATGFRRLFPRRACIAVLLAAAVLVRVDIVMMEKLSEYGGEAWLRGITSGKQRTDETRAPVRLRSRVERGRHQYVFGLNSAVTGNRDRIGEPGKESAV